MDLPITQQDDFIADFHAGKMDLTVLKDKTFIVSVNTSNRNNCKLLASTIKGPFDFFEMVENVGCMIEREKHHANVTILNKEEGLTKFLDSGTVDYIEAHWKNIISDGLLDTFLTDYTLEPGIISDNEMENPCSLI